MKRTFTAMITRWPAASTTATPISILVVAASILVVAAVPAVVVIVIASHFDAVL